MKYKIISQEMLGTANMNGNHDNFIKYTSMYI